VLRPLRVAPEHLDDVWPEAAPLLARALRLNACLDLDDVHDFIRCGAMDLLVVVDGETGELVAALTSEIVDYPRLRSLRIVLAGANDNRLLEWMDEMHDLIETGARQAGCAVMEIIGRGGWLKRLAKQGYSETFLTIQKVLEAPNG
jgi:hypothetical protein